MLMSLGDASPSTTADTGRRGLVCFGAAAVSLQCKIHAMEQPFARCYYPMTSFGAENPVAAVA